jgi:hypothetical protein
MRTTVPRSSAEALADDAPDHELILLREPERLARLVVSDGQVRRQPGAGDALDDHGPVCLGEGSQVIRLAAHLAHPLQ